MFQRYQGNLEEMADRLSREGWARLESGYTSKKEFQGQRHESGESEGSRRYGK